MKLKLATFVISFFCALGVVLPSIAEAGWYGRDGRWHDGWRGDGWRGGRYYNRGYVKCRWVGGFWRNGYWHPSRRVCWRVR